MVAQTRIAAAAVLALLAWGTAAAAATSSAPPSSPGPDRPMTTLNRKLASLVAPALTISIAPGPLAADAAADQPLPAQPVLATRPVRNPLFTPAMLALAARFTKAERILHYRKDGLDVNLWGAFEDGRGMRVRYTLKF